MGGELGFIRVVVLSGERGEVKKEYRVEWV